MVLGHQCNLVMGPGMERAHIWGWEGLTQTGHYNQVVVKCSGIPEWVRPALRGYFCDAFLLRVPVYLS